MEPHSTGVLAGLGIIHLRAILQTANMFPTFFDKLFDQTASKLTVAVVLLFASAGILAFFLQSLTRFNREGFTDVKDIPKAMTEWKKLTDDYSVAAVCSIKKQIEDKLIPVEKQTNKLTDAQAKERVAKLFPLNCELVEPVNKAKDIDTFFTTVQLLPNTFLVEVYETAEKSTQMLEKQANEIQSALQKKEGFIDPSVGICSPEVTEERRKFLREKKLDEAAQRCLLPEEVPFEKKEDVALGKLKKMQETYDAAMRLTPKKALLSDLVAKSQDLLKMLEETKKKAESGELLRPTNISKRH